MAHSKPADQPRKSLRQSLRNLLNGRRHRTAIDAPRIVGSGILRKADTATAFLPSVSQISLFPDFGSSTFGIDKYSAVLPFCTPTSSPHRPVERVVSPRRTASVTSKASLLPLTRLSQLDLRQTYLGSVAAQSRVNSVTVPIELAPGASRHASVASFHDTHALQSPPLRIQRSNRTLNRTALAPASKRSLRRTGSLAKSDREVANLIQDNSITPSPRLQHTPSDQPVPAICVSAPAEENQLDAGLRHFSSFCVLDTAVHGFPVTATSEDLRFVFDVGEQFFLHNQECAESSLDVVTGYDALGNEVTHLVLFSPLISPSSGRSRFLLAALIDLTGFLQQTAQLPELETISEESVTEDEPSTPKAESLHDAWRTPACKLSAEDLLGGCFLQEGPEAISKPKPSATGVNEDIWLHLASEEHRHAPSRSQQFSSSLSSDASYSSSKATTVDNVLDEFMGSLQQLYSDFFLLAKSPLDHNFYEIVNVSPTVYASSDYLHGHLSHTSKADIVALGEKLGDERPFATKVRWGRRGETKQMYSVPLFGQGSITWVCLLVGGDQPPLW